jgi:hypothetical protein
VPDLAISLAYTYRNGTGQPWTPRTDFTAADYSCRVSTARGFSATRCSPDHDKVLAGGNSRTILSRPDYSRSFNGFEASLTKRLSHRWMLRAAYSYNHPTESLDGPAAVNNPSRSDTSGFNLSGPQDNGGLYAPRSAGSGKGDTIIGAKWQFIANALVQLPWDLDLSGSFFSRQGQPFAVVFQGGLGDDGQVRVLADGRQLDDETYDTVTNLDMRLAKNIKFGQTTLTLAGDVFNVFNSNTVLARERRFSSSAFLRTNELLNPRVARISVSIWSR